MRRDNLRRILVVAVFVVTGPMFFLCSVYADSEPSGGVISRVFDGDTVLLESGQKVRYLGIDTPEVDHEQFKRSPCYGPEAWKRNEELVLGQRVRLEYDQPSRDRYGRLLAYVYLGDGRCVNEVLLREGYAVMFRRADAFQLLDVFLDSQQRAIEEGRGMWSACAVSAETRYLGNRMSYVFHRPSCVFGQEVSRKNRVWLESRRAAFEKGFHPCRRCRP